MKCEEAKLSLDESNVNRFEKDTMRSQTSKRIRENGVEDGPLLKLENESYERASRKELGIGKMNSICQARGRRDMLDLNRITMKQSSEAKTGLTEFRSKQSDSIMESNGHTYSIEHI